MNTKDILDIAKALRNRRDKWYFRRAALKALRDHDVASHPAILPILVDKLWNLDDTAEVLADILVVLTPHIGHETVRKVMWQCLNVDYLRTGAIRALSPYMAVDRGLVRLFLSLLMAAKSDYEVNALVRALVPEAETCTSVLEAIIGVASTGSFIRRQEAILGLLHLLPKMKGLADVLEKIVDSKIVGDRDLARYIRQQVTAVRHPAS